MTLLLAATVVLTALSLGRIERAWEAYRAGVHPGGSWGPPINVVSDTAAFLWRAELAGEPRRPELWREVRDYALKSFPKAGLPFADVHVAVACVADGDFAALERLAGELRERPVVRVLVTHFHPDHMGNADWLAQRFGVELWAPQAEWLMAQLAWRGMGGNDSELRLGHYRRHGVPADAAEAMAFALLGRNALLGIPNHLPRTTGARRAAVLGEIAPGASGKIAGRC